MVVAVAVAVAGPKLSFCAQRICLLPALVKMPRGWDACMQGVQDNAGMPAHAMRKTAACAATGGLRLWQAARLARGTWRCITKKCIAAYSSTRWRWLRNCCEQQQLCV